MHTSDWVIIGICLFFLFTCTNGFGLFSLFQSKGTWVEFNIDRLPEILVELRKNKAFMDSDGIEAVGVDMNVCMFNGEPYYQMKIPKHVFTNVEFNTILKELKIRD